MNVFKKAYSGVKSIFSSTSSVAGLRIVKDSDTVFYSFDGKLIDVDVIRAAIRPFTQNIGKLQGKHMRDSKNDAKINPDAYIKFLLEDPNPIMSGQMLQEKMAWDFMLFNNAFGLITRDVNGYANGIYPLCAYGVEAKYYNDELWLEFNLENGERVEFPYTDIIHLRRDYVGNIVFGAENTKVLGKQIEVIIASDQSVTSAIKNSNIIKWLLKFKRSLKPKDVQAEVKSFTDSFLSSEANAANVGAAGVSAEVDAQQVTPNDYVPNAAVMDRTLQRIYNYFNTNEKIVQSKYTEDEWTAYYESVIEPFAVQLAGEFTRKIFNRRERSFGNKIIFGAISLQYASMKTKLGLQQMVDRGAMTPNEWRKVLNLSPIEGGDVAIRRLDTAVVDTSSEGGDK